MGGCLSTGGVSRHGNNYYSEPQAGKSSPTSSLTLSSENTTHSHGFPARASSSATNTAPRHDFGEIQKSSQLLRQKKKSHGNNRTGLPGPEQASQPGSPLRSSGLPKVLVYADKQVRGVIDYDVTELSARETVLHHATLTTLFPLLRQFPLKSAIDFEAILAGEAWAPRDESLTPLEQQFVRGLLDEYHPEFLTISPLVDAQGQPMPVMVSPHCSLPPQVQRDCHNILQDYPAHLRWKHDTLRIKAITNKDVPSHERPLVGQEGVFATRRIKPNTFIGFFGGMVLEDNQDIMNDRTLRDEAGCSKYFGRIRGLPSAILQVMDMTMKLNTATRQENGITTISKDDPRINITMRDVALVRTTDGQPLTIACFLAKRMISPGEQLCYFYGERDDDETQKVEVEWRAKPEPGAEEEEEE